MSETLIEALEAAGRETEKGYTFLNNELRPTTWSFAALVEEARVRGAQLRARGLVPGDRVGLVLPDPEDFVLSFLGAVLAGIVPVPMYPPLALGRLDSYIESTGAILSAAGAKKLVTNKQVSQVLWTLTSKVRGLDGLILTDDLKEAREAPIAPHRALPEDPCFLQFTSGSTAAPKGVIVTHASLRANSHAIMVDGLESDPAVDKGVSWLPLYHDMGLIGFVIAPIFAQVPVVFIPTLAFVKRPTIWMETIHKHRGTITFGPNFAFGLAAKRVPKTPGALDLSCLRVIGCGAEPINPQTMRAFTDAFAPFGVKAKAVMPAYGMAEATLAMSFDRLTRPIRTIAIDRHDYEEKNVARVLGPEAGDVPASEKLELVSCGSTFPGHELGVMSERGELLPEGRVGELVFRGPSVTPGYFRDARATEELLKGGWLHTGDLGFILDGEVFISGRQKDVIILNGRNYYPQAIEWIAERAPGVRRGNVVAFSVRGDATEELVVVAESVAEDRAAVEAAVREEVRSALGLVVGRVVLVPKGSIPKTSSGKLQRRKTKAQLEDGTLGREGNRSLGSAAAKMTLARHMARSVLARLRHQIKSVLPTRATRGLLPRVVLDGLGFGQDGHDRR